MVRICSCPFALAACAYPFGTVADTEHHGERSLVSTAGLSLLQQLALACRCYATTTKMRCSR